MLPKRSSESPGFLIAFEGPDGVGKSTQAYLAAEHVRRLGRYAVLVREPGGTPLGERIREILLDPALKGVSVWAELCLYMAARAQLVKDVIQPALVERKVVVADRYLLSSIVYQGVAGGIGASVVEDIGLSATGGILPDLTIVLDLDLEEAMKRLKGAPDRMEEKEIRFHERVRMGYLASARPGRKIEVISAAGTVAEVEARVRKEIDRVLG